MQLLTPEQAAAYMRGVTHLIKAYDILNNVKVQGWQPHVLLYEVTEELLHAMESLAAVSPNNLPPAWRRGRSE